VEAQSALKVADKSNHELSLAQVRGPQASPGLDWNNAVITYSALIDMADGVGTQSGYSVNVHADGDTDFGTFEGVLAPSDQAITCQGTWTFTGGTGKYQEIRGSGKFNMRMTAKNVVTTRDGSYQLAKRVTNAGEGR
jgi:hypothetical protein